MNDKEFRENFCIPNDWGTTNLKISTYIKGRIGWHGLKANEFTSEGPYLVTGTDFKNGSIDWQKCYHISYKRFEEDKNIHLNFDDLLITKDGSIGKTAYLDTCPDQATLNSGIFLLRCIDNSYKNKFLYLILNFEYFLKFLRKTQGGSTINHLYQKEFIKFRFPVPSVIEQQEIIKMISSADLIISKTEAAIEKYKSIKQGMMHDLFTRGIDPKINKLRPKYEYAPEFYKLTKLGHIPLDWDINPLIACADNSPYSFTGGPFGSDLQTKDYTNEGVRIIQLQNIGDGIFLNDYKIYTSPQKANKLFSCNIFHGDIIIAKMADPLARACIIPPFENRYLMASDGIRLKVDEKNYNIRFILETINYYDFRKRVEAKATGSTRERIGLNELRNIVFKHPKKYEQKLISKRLEAIDDLIYKEITYLNKLQNEKQGLMKDLLTGKKRLKKNETTNNDFNYTEMI